MALQSRRRIWRALTNKGGPSLSKRCRCDPDACQGSIAPALLADGVAELAGLHRLARLHAVRCAHDRAHLSEHHPWVAVDQGFEWITFQDQQLHSVAGVQCVQNFRGPAKWLAMHSHASYFALLVCAASRQLEAAGRRRRLLVGTP